MASRKLALIMGVANQRSIAWACVQSFLSRNYDCILTYQSARFEKTVQKLIEQQRSSSSGRILGAVSCNVECNDAIPQLLQTDIPALLTDHPPFDAIVHSIAYADLQEPRLSQSSWPVFSQALHISAYSFLQLTRELVEQDLIHKADISMTGNHSSLVALTYLGAVRAVPNYQSMGPAKAALEAMVRGLAMEYGPTHQLHVNAVSAGPIATAAARGGIRNFSALQQTVKETSPLRRNVNAAEVANVVSWLSESTGVTGQTIYVDGGYSSVVPIAF
jgi:enoyl-[acyl-carrier protein] reductase I